jgi:hypothetical protein
LYGNISATILNGRIAWLRQANVMMIDFFRTSVLVGLLLSTHFPGARAADLGAQSVPAVFAGRLQHPLGSSLGMFKDYSSPSACHTQAIRAADAETRAVRRPAAVYL